MSTSEKRRVVISGIGILSSLGSSPEEIIAGIRAEEVTFEKASFDDTLVAAPIRTEKWLSSLGSFKEKRYLNRGALLCVSAALQAIANAGMADQVLADAGLFLGMGPNLDIGGEFPEVLAGEIDRRDLMALWILRFLPNTAAAVIARLAGIHGENATLVTACSASLQAIGEAFRKIRDGYLPMAVAGGGDSRLHPGGLLAYKKARALCCGISEPSSASRPFDEGRQGFVPGEGGAVFVLEELEQARRRRARIYAEICGCGTSLDGYSMTDPDPQGKWGERAVRKALAEAGMSPAEIEVVSAHGTATLLNDAMEANLIERVYGNHRPEIIAWKSWIGHASAACGALELALTLTGMHSNLLPAIRNLEDPCHPLLNLNRRTKAKAFRTFIIENFGFGGQNVALALRRIE